MKSAFRKHKLLLVASLLGVSAAAVSYASISPFVTTSPVVVAAHDIDQYGRIEASDIRVVGLPAKSLPKGRFTDSRELIGAYALSRIVAGQVLLGGHVARGSGDVGLSLDLPPDMRCVFVPAGPDRAVGGLIKQGEMVDIVFTPKGGGYAAQGGTAPYTVRSLRVLEVCRDASSRAVFGVVVLASWADAETIAHNLESCAISLLLAPRDSRTEMEPGVWLPQ